MSPWHGLDILQCIILRLYKKKKYTCGSGWIVLHCVKNNNPRRHLLTSSYSEITTVKNFLAIFLLEEVPPMLPQSPDEPLFIHLPQDYGDLSAG